MIVFRDKNGNEITSLTHTVAYWLNHRNSNFLLGIDPGSGGKFSIRFCYGWHYQQLANGTVEIIRNGFVIDRDRLFAC